MATDSKQLCIGLNVEDEIRNSAGLSATNTFVTLSTTTMQVGPVDAMSQKIEEQVFARTNVQVWINRAAIEKPDIQPIKAYSHDMLLTKEQTINVYSILYGSLIAGFSNATPIYFEQPGDSNANADNADSNTNAASSDSNATAPAATGSNV